MSLHLEIHVTGAVSKVLNFQVLEIKIFRHGPGYSNRSNLPRFRLGRFRPF